MVKFNYEGKDYELEFNRKTAVALQRQGFDPDMIWSKNLIMIPMLVRGAFQMNHSSVKDKKIDEIYEKIDRKSEFLQELVKSYLLTCSVLFEDSEDKNGDDEKSDFMDWSAD